ncbi:zinc finger and BTB domain-containing protein 24-like isoform X13 [Cloeon dipterum]|uniref:zinc finger and BTB domain-containing protein 24-like isoform X13 n=1 Tax=Cloeon dipterum TaxID=197152 RepID=UPI0032206AD4
MASRQYSLRWNNYAKHLSTAFDSLRSERDLTDVTLSCEGKRVPAHKMLLSACSSYFKSLFKENPCQHPVIIFRNVAFDDLMALVEFMYKGEVNVEEERLSSFLTTAELLEVQGLTNSGKDVDKSKKTDDLEKETDIMEQQPEADSSPFAPFVDTAKSSPPTPSASRKRRRVSPPETEEESLPKVAALEEDPVIESDDHDVHLKTEAPDFEHIELNPEDSVDADDMAAAGQDLESEVDNFAMAGPSNDSLVEDKDREPQSSKDSKAAAVPVKLNSGCYACPVCNKYLSDRFKCALHIKTHFCETTCSVCGREFGRPGDLKLHMALHEGRTTCPKCKKVFSRADRLKIHLNKCSGT